MALWYLSHDGMTASMIVRAASEREARQVAARFTDNYIGLLSGRDWLQWPPTQCSPVDPDGSAAVLLSFGHDRRQG
jgi:hypothetical protein